MGKNRGENHEPDDEEFDQLDDGPEGDGLDDLYGAEIVDYDLALGAAVQALHMLNEDARKDVVLFAIGQYGAVQMIGSGKHIPTNAEVLLQGPAIVVYGKDARELHADLEKRGMLDGRAINVDELHGKRSRP